jgi:hypothetical protein
MLRVVTTITIRYSLSILSLPSHKFVPPSHCYHRLQHINIFGLLISFLILVSSALMFFFLLKWHNIHIKFHQNLSESSVLELCEQTYDYVHAFFSCTLSKGLTIT